MCPKIVCIAALALSKSLLKRRLVREGHLAKENIVSVCVDFFHNPSTTWLLLVLLIYILLLSILLLHLL